MRKLTAVAMAAFLLVTAPAFAQMQNPSAQSQMSLTGKISSIDLAQGTLTLDNGYQFTLAPNFQYTSFPMVGQEVEVIYDERGGQKVAHSIDQASQGKSDE
jgi:hypothetical protein